MNCGKIPGSFSNLLELEYVSEIAATAKEELDAVDLYNFCYGCEMPGAPLEHLPYGSAKGGASAIASVLDDFVPGRLAHDHTHSEPQAAVFDLKPGPELAEDEHFVQTQGGLLPWHELQ